MKKYLTPHDIIAVKQQQNRYKDEEKVSGVIMADMIAKRIIAKNSEKRS